MSAQRPDHGRQARALVGSSAWLVALLVPTVVLSLVLKIVRLMQAPATGPWWVRPADLVSDLTFGAAWIVGWWALVVAGSGRLTRALVLIAAQLTTWAWSVLLVVHHEYWTRTGITLTLDRLVPTWRARNDLWALLGSQLTGGTLALLAWATSGCTLLPTLLVVLGRAANERCGGRPIQARAIQVISLPADHRARAYRVVVGLAAALALVGGSTWTLPTTSARFGRAALTDLVAVHWEGRNAFGDVDVPASEPLTPTQIEGISDGRNVVMIVLESQRGTSTLPATERPVTPFLDELSTHSLTAERAYVVTPHTSKSLTAIHCGVAPPLDTANSEADERGIAGPCLPELLVGKGYRTAFFQSATEQFERRRDLAGQLGFQLVESADTLSTEGFEEVNYFGYEDDVMLEPSREWMARNRAHPFLLSYLTVTAHHDYRLPTGIEPQDFVDDPKLNDYLNGLSYQDRFVRRVVDQVKDLGLYEKTVFVVVGDHGEGFGEHGVRQHDNTIYEEGIRVPLIIHDPRAGIGRSISEPVQQTAIMPTVTDLLGYRLHGSRPGGSASLLSTAPRDPVNVTCFDNARCLARLEGDLKYVHHFGDRRDEVFDLATDPSERHNLHRSTDPDWLAQQRAAVLSWRLSVDQIYHDLRTPG
jgi:lipoteichoic acid synthase